MTLVTDWRDRWEPYEVAGVSANTLSQRILGGAALAFVAFACAWTMCVNVGNTEIGSSGDVAAPRGDALVAPRGNQLTGFAHLAGDFAALRNEISVLAPQSTNITPASFEARFSAGFPTGSYFGDAASPVDQTGPAAGVPVRDAVRDRARRRMIARAEAARRDAAIRWQENRLASLRIQEGQTAAVPARQAFLPSFFERLFGNPKRKIFQRLYGPSPSDEKLAYASTAEDVASDAPSVTSGLYDRQTAVYDISTHTVYLPNGTTLEAHSGLGAALDRPSSAAERDRGVTPPDIYDLKLRGRLFHGVQAIRLLPENEAKVFGRSGLLAHTYMLGPNGQSNGCVSFKHYKTFLDAFENHEITRLAVVSRID